MTAVTHEIKKLYLSYKVGDNVKKKEQGWLAPSRALHLLSSQPFYVVDTYYLNHISGAGEYVTAAELLPSEDYFAQLTKVLASEQELRESIHDKDSILYLTEEEGLSLKAVYQEWAALPEVKQQMSRDARAIEERFDALVDAILAVPRNVEFIALA